MSKRLLLLCFFLVAYGALICTCVDAGQSGPTLESVQELIQQGEFDAAEAGARALVAAAETSSGPNSVEVAAPLEALVDALIGGGRGSSPECLELAERAVRIRESQLGSDPSLLIGSLHGLGSVFVARSQYKEACQTLERALQIHERSGSVDDEMVAKIVGHLGNVYVELGRYAEARPMLERELAIQKQSGGDEDPSMVRLQYNLARLLRRTGEYDEAERRFKEALDVAERIYGPNHLYVAYLLNGLANVHDELADYTRARDDYRRALVIAEKEAPDHPLVASCLNNLGYVLTNLGDYEEATKVYERALELGIQTRGRESDYTASTMANLADVYQKTKRTEEAKELREQALEIRERVLGLNHPAVATSLQDLAEVYIEVGQPVLARPLGERALRIRREAFGSEHVDTGAALVLMARILERSGEPQAAEARYREAMATFEASLGDGNARTSEVMADLAWLLTTEGDEAEAMELALQAETLSRDHARLMASALPERQALRFAAVRARGLDVAITLAAGSGDPGLCERVWDAVIRSRALVLDEMLARRSVPRDVDPQADSLRVDYAAASKELAHLMIRGPLGDDPGTYRKRLEAARVEHERAEEALARASTAFQLERKWRSVGFADVRASMPPETALVAFVKHVGFEDSDHDRGHAERGHVRIPVYSAMVLPSGGAPAVAVLGSAAEIERLVTRYRGEVGRPPPDTGVRRARHQAAGAALRRLIWDPVAPLIEEARNVFIVPDGSLHLVSFAALPADEDRYLIEAGYRLHYLSAERDVAQPSLGPERGDGLLIVGGPAFDGVPAAESQQLAQARGMAVKIKGSAKAADLDQPDADEIASWGALHFEPLPGTTAEAQTIVSLWSEPTVRPQGDGAAEVARSTLGAAELLSGVEATEGAVKQRAGGHRVVHFATHGFFLEGHSALTGVPSSRGDDGDPTRGVEVKQRQISAASPLRLSGLAFAGANHCTEAVPDGEDGILLAEEVAALDLRGTEWVVLSACETGIGRLETHEGVLGLRRAFHVAGAETLIMSLWPVEDAATQRWMEALYRSRLVEGASTVESVSLAMLEVLAERRAQGSSDHPFYWAAFLAVGDWR